MSKKHLLERTKRQFVEFLNQQSADVVYTAMTTDFNAHTEFAKFRRSFIRTMNNANLRELKS